MSIDIWVLPSEVEPNGSSWYVVIDPGENTPRSRRDRAEITPRLRSSLTTGAFNASLMSYSYKRMCHWTRRVQASVVFLGVCKLN